MRDKTSKERLFRPFFESHLGLSGIKKINTKKATAGTTSAQNIQRQPVCPFQEFNMKVSLDPSATGSAIT